MRIAVVQPPIRDFYQTSHRHSALGALTVKEILERAGHEVVLFNFPGDSDACHTPPLPGELNYLKPFLIGDEKGPVSWFRQRRHFGPSLQECSEKILAVRPDRVLLSCFAWCYAGEAKLLAEDLKHRAPDLPLEIGGAGVSVNPEWFEKTGLFENVRMGEAEKNLADFPGAESLNPPLTQAGITPVLNRVETHQGLPRFSTMLTRGCPYRCLFCANHLTHGRDYRKTDLAAVMVLLEKTGEKVFHLDLEDDNLLFDEEYFCSFLKQFHSRYPKSTLSMENGLDYRHLNKALLVQMTDSGFIRFNLSMASSDSQILSSQNRKGGNDKLKEVLIFLEQKSIPAVTYFICGLEGDTVESVSRNLIFLADLPTEIGISPFYAVPGLPGFEHPGKNGLPETPALYCGSSVWPWNENLTTPQLITAFRLSRFINLLKSPDRSIWQELIHKTLETKRLYTSCGKGRNRRLIEVPHMDTEMCERVISCLSST